jgi:hypothetical protein
MPHSTAPLPKHVAIMRIIVSLTVLVFGILILTAPNFLFSTVFNDGIQKIAAGWIGAVIGYWLA